MHRQNIERVVNETFARSDLSVKDVDAIAVTNRPGLSLSLSVGLRYAKHLARSYGKPIIPVHHMEAHALTVRASHKVQYPYLCLLASGGHCLLTIVHNVNSFDLMGESLDDAPGEAFDKIARELKLRNIPQYEWLCGGQAIEIASSGANDPDRFAFPLPLARQRNCQFSFAGLKNTAKRHISKTELELGLHPDQVMPNHEDFCAGFLRAIVRHLCHRTQRAIEYCEDTSLFAQNSRKQLVFSGGVACNDFAFKALTEMAAHFGYEVHRPEPKYCTDNGLMIAWNGIEKWISDEEHLKTTNIDSIITHPKCPLGNNIIGRVEEASIACKWVKLKIYNK